MSMKVYVQKIYRGLDHWVFVVCCGHAPDPGTYRVNLGKKIDEAMFQEVFRKCFLSFNAKIITKYSMLIVYPVSQKTLQFTSLLSNKSQKSTPFFLPL